MQWLSGGRFEMGESNTVPDEFPPHPVELDGFWIDTTEVTNRQFKEFVDATGYLTTAERPPELRSIMPDSELAKIEILPEMNKPGSIWSCSFPVGTKSILRMLILAAVRSRRKLDASGRCGFDDR